MIDWIEILQNKGDSRSKRVLSSEEHELVMQETSFLPSGTALSVRKKALLMGVVQTPKCPCGNITKTKHNVYKKHCSKKCLYRYSVVHPSSTEGIKERKRQTNLINSGKSHNWSSIPSHIKVKLEDYHYMQSLYSIYGSDQIAKILGVGATTALRALKKLNISVGAHRHASSVEKWIAEYIRNIKKLDVITRDRNLIFPHEIDVVIPNIKLAIEYNGRFWHSERSGKNKSYHYDKIIKARDAGYNLIHLWDHYDINHIMGWINFYSEDYQEINDIVKTNMKILVRDQTSIVAEFHTNDLGEIVDFIPFRKIKIIDVCQRYNLRIKHLPSNLLHELPNFVLSEPNKQFFSDRKHGCVLHYWDCGYLVPKT